MAVQPKHSVFSWFQGYSFVAPSILFNKNVVMGDVLNAEANIDRPGSATVQRSAMLKVHSIRLKKKNYKKFFKKTFGEVL